MLELFGGYFIDEKPNGQCVLKQKYTGIRKGKEVECAKILSYHKDIPDAAEAFLRLIKTSKTDSMVISIEEYIKRIREENTKAVEIIQESFMKRFFIQTPQAKGMAHEEHSIVDLIPVGRENAIKRKALVALCVHHKLINEKISDSAKDRHMRALVEAARRDFTILNLSNGEGYYRVSRADLQDLQRYIRQEENRAKSTFRNISMAKALYEDYKAGRIDDGECRKEIT